MIQEYRPVDITGAQGAVPIRCFTGETLLPDAPARQQLLRAAAVPGLDRYVTVLPDVHYKSRNPTPSGTVVVTRDVILPRAVDDGINCGMRIIATSVPARTFTPAVLDRLYGTLLEAIPLKKHATPMLSEDECIRGLVHGLEALRGPLGLPDHEVGRVENRGRTLPELDVAEIAEVVTAKAVRKGLDTLGTVGAGNHFLELQEIVEVLDPHAAERLGLRAGETVFMLHSDSRRLGKKILKPIHEEAEATYRTEATGDLWGIPVESALGRRYLCGIAAASHSGFANRAAVTQIVRRTMRTVLGDGSLEMPLVYDCGHETIQHEIHGGQPLWVHRHGASRALPAAGFTHDPVLAELGQPVPIAGCMGTDSFIGVARPGADLTFHSVAHGAGRVMEKARAAETFAPADVETQLRARNIRLYHYGADNIAGQAPASFKDVHAVMEAMASMELLRPVARLRPIAVMKG